MNGLTARLPLWAGALSLCLSALSTGCDPCSRAPGTLCRIAGNGESGFNGDGQAPEATSFYGVTAAHRGPDGRLYLMDYNNHRLRYVDGDGRVQTLVGTGEHDYAKDGAPARDTPLENPIDFAFSPSGRLHVVMLHDPRVLRLEVDGRVRVVAGSSAGDDGDGGPALEARFSELNGIVFAPDGAMYLADGVAHRVRRVDPDGVVRAVAGTGTPGYSGDGADAREAQLDAPRGLALDSEGNLYIADAGNHRIRRVRPDGTIETFAGTGEPGFTGDGGPAKQAQLRRPQGVAVDADGRVYIADSDNHRVRRVERDGMVRTIAGTGARGLAGNGGDALKAELGGPFALDFDGTGALLISEQRNSSLSVLYLEEPQ